VCVCVCATETRRRLITSSPFAVGRLYLDGSVHLEREREGGEREGGNGKSQVSGRRGGVKGGVDASVVNDQR